MRVQPDIIHSNGVRTGGKESRRDLEVGVDSKRALNRMVLLDQVEEIYTARGASRRRSIGGRRVDE